MGFYFHPVREIISLAQVVRRIAQTRTRNPHFAHAWLGGTMSRKESGPASATAAAAAIERASSHLPSEPANANGPGDSVVDRPVRRGRRRVAWSADS